MIVSNPMKPKLLSKARKKDQFICRKQPNGIFKCPERKKEIMAIPLNQQPLPDFRYDAKTEWPIINPLMKIDPLGKSPWP